MIRLTLKQLAAHKGRLLTTTAAVLLGVTFLAGTLILTDTIDHTLDNLLANANAGTDAYIRNTSDLDLGYGEARPRLDETLVEQVQAFDGVDQAAVRIGGYAQIIDKAGEPVGNPLQAPAFGLNWITVDELNAYQIDTGHAPASDDEIVIDKRSAHLAGFHPGDRTMVLSSGAPREFVIAGIATFSGADSPGNATTVLFTNRVAQELLGEPGRIDGIAVTAAAGVTQTALAESLQRGLGGAVEVITGAQLTNEDQTAVAENLAFFNVFLFVFAAIAVFVGAFIINNTFSITVAQRTREMAMLRAIGADRRQILRSLLVEALAIALVASTAGLVLGRAAAAGLTALLGSFGFDMPDGAVVLSQRTIIVALTVGVIVTLASAILPARRAGRVAPIEAMRNTAYEQTRPSRHRAAVGTVISAVGIGALFIALGNEQPGLVGLGAAIVFIGVSVLGPILVRPVTRVLGAPLPIVRGLPGGLAQHNAMRNPTRTARTAAALMIGVGLVGFITIFASSLRSSIAGTFDEDFTGTHILDSGAFDATAGVSTDLADAIREQPGVTGLSATRIARTEIDGTEQILYAFDATTIGSLFDLGTIHGDITTLGPDGIAISTRQATSNGWELGDTLPVTFATGTTNLVVRATYDSAQTWVGDEFVDLTAFDANVPDLLDARIYVTTTNPAELEAATAAYPSVKVLDEQGYLDSKNADIDALLGVIYAMLALAVLIALLGIANTLTLSILERTRELGLLRALGMNRAQLRATVRWEAVLIAVFGTTLGLTIGTFFGWALVRSLANDGMHLHIPIANLALVTVIAVLAGVGAAVMPARRAARRDILQAIAAT
jgi:putative ABC transport system permease protein